MFIVIFAIVEWHRYGGLIITAAVVLILAWATRRQPPTPKTNEPKVLEELQPWEVTFSVEGDRAIEFIKDALRLRLRNRGVRETDLDDQIVTTMRVDGEILVMTISVLPPYNSDIDDRQCKLLPEDWDRRDGYSDPAEWARAAQPPDGVPKGWGELDYKSLLPREWDSSSGKGGGGVIEPGEGDDEDD